MERNQTSDKSSTAVKNFPEIVIGLVGAVGSELHRFQGQIEKCLALHIKPNNPQLAIKGIKLIDCLTFNDAGLDRAALEEDLKRESSRNNLPKKLELRLQKFLSGNKPLTTPADADLKRYLNMLAGDLYRKKMSELLADPDGTTPDKGGMAVRAVIEIQQRRENVLAERDVVDEPSSINTVYILHSLKHPDEVKVLRTIYGEGFILIGAYKEERERRATLKTEMEKLKNYDGSDAAEVVDYFIRRDMKDAIKKHGQNVQQTFPLSDLFLKASARDDEIKRELARFIKLLFSNPRKTPTKDEYAMFHAYVASLRSSAATRQVGVAITNDDGEILVLGTNEVAKLGGGHYWPGDDPDRRDIHEAEDPNSREKRRIRDDLFQKMKPLLMAGVTREVFEAQVDKSKLADITEFDRTVHAEMSALCFAARQGVSIKGGTLYCTTYPCHLCAKNILAAGIKKVVYIEPYPKSKAPELYPEFFGIRPSKKRGNGFPVTPFMGIGPRLYSDLFSVHTSFGIEVPRKDQKGKIIKNPELALKLPTRDASQAEMEAFYVEKEEKLRSPK